MMKELDSAKLRNIALVGHGNSGKTSVAEMLLYMGGMTERLGGVQEGNSMSDFDPDEIERKISISMALLYTHHREFKINILDVPGYADFLGEMIAAIRAVDAALLVVNAESGVEVQTEVAWQRVKALGLPAAAVINRMDKERANYASCLESLRQALGTKVLPLFAPIGTGELFTGVVNVMTGRAYQYAGTPSREVQESDIPDEMRDEIAALRESLVEMVAESDDEMLGRFFEGQLSNDEILKTMAKGIRDGLFIPAIPVCALRGIGAFQLLDLIVDHLPSPLALPPLAAQDASGNDVTIVRSPNEPFCGMVFKTVADPYTGKLSFIRAFAGSLDSDSGAFNATQGVKERIATCMSMQGKTQKAKAGIACGDIGVVAKLSVTKTGDTLCDSSRPVVLPAVTYPEAVSLLAIFPKSRADEEKLTTATGRLVEEDPTFHLERNAETSEILIYGMGDLHLDVILCKLKRKFGLELDRGTPKVAFRETIRKAAQSQGRYKKQTGGRGQFGDVWIELEPTERGGGFEFVDAIVGGVVPKNYIPAVEKGIVEAMTRGVLAGFPMVDMRAKLYDGSYHAVDSSEMSFKIAASMGFQQAAAEAGLYLLEPVMEVEIIAPEENMGDVIGDLNGRRGRILGFEPSGRFHTVKAKVPLQELFTYSSTLRSLTSGRGSYTMRFSSYEEVPAEISKKIVAEIQASKNEGQR